MLRLPHTGVTPDMLGEIQSLLGVVGLDKARADLDATDRARPRSPRTSSAIVRHTRENPGPRARRELPRGDPPAERREGAGAPRRPRPRHDRGRARRGAVRPAPPPDLPRGHDAGRRARRPRSTARPPRARRDAAPRPRTLYVRRAPRSSARFVSTRARCIRNSAEAAVSLDGSVPSAACAAASAGEAPLATASSTARARSGVPPMFVERDRGTGGGAVVAVDERRDADGRPVLGPAVVLEVRPAGRARRASAPGSRSAARPGPTAVSNTPVKKSAAATTRSPPVPDDHEARRRAPASPRAGPRPDRRGRASRRSCRDDAPAGRRSCPPSSRRSGSAPGAADRACTAACRVSAPIASCVPASRT